MDLSCDGDNMVPPMRCTPKCRGEWQMEEGFVIWAYEQFWHVLASRIEQEVDCTIQARMWEVLLDLLLLLERLRFLLLSLLQKKPGNLLKALICRWCRCHRAFSPNGAPVTARSLVSMNPSPPPSPQSLRAEHWKNLEHSGTNSATLRSLVKPWLDWTSSSFTRRNTWQQSRNL